MAELALLRCRLRWSLENLPLDDINMPPPKPVGSVRRERILGGLLNHYYRKAA